MNVGYNGKAQKRTKSYPSVLKNEEEQATTTIAKTNSSVSKGKLPQLLVLFPSFQIKT